MDNPAAPIPSTIPQPAVSSLPAEALAKTGLAESPNHRWLLWSAGGLFMLIIGIALGIFSAKFLNQSQRQTQLASTPTSTLLPTPTSTPDSTADWKTYRSTFWNIELKYPSEINLTNTNVLEQEVLRFENNNGYMQIENACATGTQGNPEDTVFVLTQFFPRYRLPKSGEFNQLYLHTNALKVTDQRCFYVIFGLRPEFEKTEKLLFDQILSTFQFLK